MEEKSQFAIKISDDAYVVNQELKPIDVSLIDYDTPDARVYFAINRSEADKEYTFEELNDLLIKGEGDFLIHIGLKYGFFHPIWDDSIDQVVYKVDSDAETKFLKMIGR